jgi:glycosyltransferase involved in cell wall biosynthesis
VDGSGLARPWAGVGTYTREVVTAMMAARPDARLTVYTPHGVEADLPGAVMQTAPSVRLLGRHLLWPLGLRRSGGHAYFSPAGSLPLAGPGLPAVLTAHDMAIYRNPAWFPGRQWLSVKVVVPRSMRAADAIVAVSSSTARDLAELFGVDAHRVTVVHEGVSPSFRPLPEAALAASRERLRLPRSFVLFVSTIEPRKNLATLLDAWGRIAEPPPLVVVGGWGWRHEELRGRLERLTSRGVRLLGGIGPEQLPAVYNLATVLAHPAWYEGFGLTVLEAMACGTPVIASSASSLPEVVGTSGLLVDPGDVEGWTAALERVLGDRQLRQDLRARGLERAAGFTWQRAATATWQVIDKVL